MSLLMTFSWHSSTADLLRWSRILPFVLHLVGRPLTSVEPLQRDDIASLSNFRAEAAFREKAHLGLDY